MKTFVKSVIGAAAALAIGASAQADFTPAQIQAMVTAKGLTVVGGERSNDGAVDVVAVADAAGWPYAFTLVDIDQNGSKDLLMLLTFVPNQQPPLQFVNMVNENAASKAFVTGGHATLTYLLTGLGTVDMATINGAWDIYQMEWNSFRQQVLQQSSGGNFLGVSNADPDAIDAGMSRVQVTARDAALTATLNQAGSHADLGAFDEVAIDPDSLVSAATEAAQRYLND